MPLRHRIFGRVVRKSLRGASAAAQLAFWASIYSVLLPFIVYIMLSQAREEHRDREGKDRERKA